MQILSLFVCRDKCELGKELPDLPKTAKSKIWGNILDRMIDD